MSPIRHAILTLALIALFALILVRLCRHDRQPFDVVALVLVLLAVAVMP